MRKIIATVLLLLATHILLAQNAIVGTGFSSGWGGGSCPTGNGNFTYFSAGAGTSWGSAALTPNGTGNQFWRFGVDWSGTFKQLTNTIGSDVDVTPNTTYSLNTNCTTSGALRYNVPSTSYRYIFKTLNAGTDPTGTWVFFEIQGTPVTVSSVTRQNPAEDVPTRITATLSGSLPAGQAVYLRCTNNNYTTSTVIQMTGSGTTYTADIPASINSSAANVSYYVFTSGTANVATNGSNADLYTINLNNNGGSNYTYTVPTTYYSKGNLTANTASNWNTKRDGTGTNATNFTTSGTVFVVQPSHSMTVTGAAMTIGTGVTLQIENTGRIIASNTLTIQGTMIVLNGGTYQHNVNGGTISTATWNSGSTCEITGITNTAPTSGLGQSFHHFTWNCPNQTAAAALNGNLTTILGDFSVTDCGSATGTLRDLRLNTNSTSSAITVSKNLDIGVNGVLALINSGSNGTGTGSLTVNGNVTVSGKLDMTGSSANTATSSTLNLKGNLTVNSTGSIVRSQATPATINFNKSNDTQTFSQAGTIGNVITWNVGDGTTTNTLKFLSDINLGAAANVFNVLNNAGVDFQTFVLSGSGTFNAQTGSTLTSANTNTNGAFNTTAVAAGSVRTNVRAFSNAGVNYIFNGATSQFTGNAISVSSIGGLTINNSAGVTLSANAAVSGTLTLTAGTLNLDTRTLTYSGTNITRTSGNINASNASAIMAFTNTSALTLPANLFTGNINTLTINGSGGVTLSSATTVESTLNLTNGVLTNGSHLTLSTGATINRNAGSLSAAPTFGTSVNVTYSNTASLNGGNELPTSASVLNNLTTTGSSVVILTAPLQINGTLAISGSGNFNVSTYTLTFAGTSITKGGSGVLNVNTAGAGLTFANTTALTLPANLFNASNIQNLTIDGGGGITLASSISVSNTLTFINGKIILGANNLTLTSATVTGASSSNYIVTNSTGSVICSIANGNTFTFYIGRNTTNISPVTISNTGSSPVIYTVSAANTTYTTPADATNMQWSIAASASTTSTLAFEWATADAGANLSADPTNGKAFQYNGTTWDNRGGVTTGSPNITTVTGITDLTNPIWAVALESVVLPTVTTNAATSITTTSVVLNGTINANGVSTTASFDYGTTLSYGSNVVADQSPVTGSSPTGISKTLSSLFTNTLYNFRAKGVNTNGTVNGNNATFTTLSNAPTIGTGDNVTAVGFRANWTTPTNDGTEAITYEIQVSTNNTNETNFVANIVTTQSGVSATNFTFTTLNRVTTYYYRVRAVNAGGNSAWSAISTAITTLNATVASDAFRSFQSGNWNATSTWESFSAGSWIAATLTPNSSAATITILNTHTVTVTANVTVDELIIEGGAQVTVNSGVTLTAANGTGNDIIVYGVLRNLGTLTLTGTMQVFSQGVYDHAVSGATIALPTVANIVWETGATLKVSGTYSTATAANAGDLIGNETRAFANVLIDCNFTNTDAYLSLSAGTLTIDTLKIVATGNGEVLASTLNATTCGTYIQTGGLFYCGRNNGTNRNLTVNGNVTISGGALHIKNQGNSAAGQLFVGGNLTVGASGTLTNSGTAGTARLNFTGSSPQIWSNEGTFSATGSIGFVIEVTGNGGVTLNNNIALPFASNLTLTNGDVTVASGATLSLDGSSTFSNVSGRKLLINGSVIYSSSAASTFTGAGAITVNNGGTYINQAGASPTLSGAGAITLQAGATFIHNTTSGIATPLNNFSINANSTFIYRGSSTLTPSLSIAGRTYGNLLFESTSGTLNLSTNTGSNPLTVQGNFFIAQTGSGNVNYTINGYTGNININGNLEIGTAGSLSVNTNTINIMGNLTNNGTFNTGSSTVVFNGTTNQNIAGNIAFNNLTVNKSSGILTANNNLSINAGGALTLTAGTFNDGGNIITIAGDIIGTATHTSNTNGKLVLTGINKTIDAVTLDNVEISSGSNFSLSGNTTINGVLQLNANLTVGSGRTLNAGTSSVISANTNQLTGTGTININGIFKTTNINGFSGTNASIPNATVNFGTNATVEYNATVAQVFSARSDYRNVTLDGNSIKTLNGNAVILGTLTLTNTTDILAIDANTLTLEGTIEASGNGFLRGGISSNLTINGTGALGTLNFDQSTDGTTNVINTFTLNRASTYPTYSAVLGNKLVITNVYNPQDGLINTGNALHLRSTASNTARISVGSAAGGYIYGDVIVERYISALGNRAYRLLTPGVTTTSTIRQNWQEGVSNTQLNVNIPSPTPGYGTHITGSINPNSLTAANAIAGGFDVTQNNQYSLYYFNQNTQSWIPATNTNTDNLDAKKGYLLFVRGNRDNINTINTTTGNSNTILRARGTLLQGHQTFSNLASNGDLSLVTNPFASSINWGTIYTGTNATNFENYITIWDPNIGTRGGFVTVNNINDVSNNASNLTINIQSGQAFFIKTKPSVTSPSFFIAETDKSITNNLDVFRTGTQTERLKIQLRYTASGIDRNADGVLVKFANAFSNAVDENDAIQMANWDEDVAIVRAGNDLSIESRNLISDKDTIFLKIANLRSTQGTYRWVIEPEQFNAPGLEAFLEDNFTNTSTPISLTATTTINFTVTTNTASTAANRFRIVFRTMGALPVNFITVTAVNKQNKNYINWQVGEEVNIKHYVIERSTDGRLFTNLSTITANNANIYSFVDDKPIIGYTNFYRIVAVGLEGKLTYSNVVKVNTNATKQPIVEVYPNPIVNNVIQLSFSNMLADNYSITLYNSNGQKVYQTNIAMNGSVNKTIPLSPAWASGIYKLVVVGLGNNQSYSTTVLKK